MEKCSYQNCENEAEFIDSMDDPVCSDCMEREVTEYNDAEFEDFTRISALSSAQLEGKQ